MLVICTKKKVTASRTFEKGKSYDVRSSDAQKGIDAEEAYFKAASKADSDKFYTAKQKAAAVRVKKTESKIQASGDNTALTKQLEEKLSELHLKGEALDVKAIELDDKIKELDAAIKTVKETKAE